MRKRWRLPALVLGLAATVPAGGWCWRALDSWRFDSALREAKATLAGGSRPRSRDALAALAERWPGRGEVEFLLGASEQSLGRLEAASRAWGRVPAGSTFAPASAMFRARLALRSDRFAEAEGPLIEALRGKGPLAIEARETLVSLYKIQGRFGEARTLVLGGWGTYPDSSGLLRELEKLGSSNPMSVVDMRLALEKAAKTAPDDDRIWLGRANYATRTGQLAEARAGLETCLKRRPDDPAIWRGWLDWANATQETAEVARALRHLPVDWLAPAEVLTLRAWFAAQAGDDARERRAQQDLLLREPGDLKALERLADIALRAGRAEEAARLRGRRAELSRIKVDYAARLFDRSRSDVAETARMAEALGRLFEASSLWATALKVDPGNAEGRSALLRLKQAEAEVPPGPTIAALLAELDANPTRPAAGRAFAGTVPAFVDDAEAAGLRFRFVNGATPEHHMPETTAGGIALIDYDGDGHLDVFANQGGPFPADPDHPRGDGDRLWHNRGDGTFEDATASSGLAAFARGYGHGVAVGDYDDDGHPDLFITRWRRYALYRNRGDGTFEDATERAGLGGDRDWPTSAVLADLDGDGDADLYVCHYLDWDAVRPNLCRDHLRDRYAYCAPQNLRALPDHLFRNDGGRFVDVSAEAGITQADKDGRGLGVVAADLDGDGKLDLFVTNDQSANFLFRNLGGMRFEEVAATSGVACNADGNYQASMGVAAADVDGDGRIDLAKTNFFNESTTLYQNRGGGIFVDATLAYGLAAPSRYLLGFGAAFLDANNDGWPDLATANGHVDDFRPETPWQMPAQLLMGAAGRRLVDVSGRAGPPWKVPRVGRGLAAGDLDNDGRVDLLVASLDVPLAYFHNRTDGGHWLTLALQGTAGGRDAVGARVEVVAGGRRRSGWRVGGGSFQSANDPRLHFGLGPADRVEAVEVAWPSGRVDRHGPIAVDSGYLLREGNPGPSPLPGFAAPAGAISARR